LSWCSLWCCLRICLRTRVWTCLWTRVWTCLWTWFYVLTSLEGARSWACEYVLWLSKGRMRFTLSIRISRSSSPFSLIRQFDILEILEKFRILAILLVEPLVVLILIHIYYILNNEIIITLLKLKLKDIISNY